MDLDAKKISFGFSKISKNPKKVPKPPDRRVKIDLIECLEDQSIKVKGKGKEIKAPLVIPVNESSRSIVDRIKAARLKRAPDGIVDSRPDSELTPDELAARELLREVQNNGERIDVRNVHTLTVKTENTAVEEKEESTLEDYEKVPISDYGMAMLRGMGWKEGMGIGKSQKVAKTDEPALRPKGMGLGASRMANQDVKNKPVVDQDGKELCLMKGTFAKVIAGHHKGIYCEVIGLDDEAGRIIVKTALNGAILSFNEFLVTPVTKEEYMKSSKVINSAKYEEYKEKHKSNIKTEKRDEENLSSEGKVSSSTKTRNTSRNSSPFSTDSEPEHGRKHRDHCTKKKKSKKYKSRSRSPSTSSKKHKKKSKHKSKHVSCSDDDRSRSKYKSDKKYKK